MAPYRQDLSGVSDDGTLVGRGGRKQQLGRAALGRMGARSTTEAGGLPPEAKPLTPINPGDISTPMPPSGGTTKPLPGYDVQSLIGRLNATGATGEQSGAPAVPPGVLGRMAQLARERGMMPNDNFNIEVGLPAGPAGAVPVLEAPSPAGPAGVSGAAPPVTAPKPLAGYSVGPTATIGGAPAGGVKPGPSLATGGGLRPPPRPRFRGAGMGDLAGGSPA